MIREDAGGDDKRECPTSPSVSFPTFLIGNPRFFLQAGDTQMKGQKKDHGFPLTTGGNDRRGTGGNDKRGDRRGMTTLGGGVDPVEVVNEDDGVNQPSQWRCSHSSRVLD